MNRIRSIISVICMAVGVLPALSGNDTIRVSDFGVYPDRYANSVEGIQAAVNACRTRQGVVLYFAPGRYDVWPEGAVRKEIFISNTSSETECPSKIKTIGVHFYDLHGLKVAAEGATLMMHGSITPVAIDRCSDIAISGLTIDWERPGGSEMTYLPCDSGGVTMLMHRDSRYDIRNRRLHLVGEGWQSEYVHCIKYNPATRHMTYSNDWNVLSGSDATEQAPGVIHFDTPDDFKPATGDVLTLRDRIRRQVGFLTLESRDVTLTDVTMHYMHGLGMISQYTRNITMRRVNCLPRPGRLLASSADFMHFSGCSGKVLVEDCNYSGSHDDAINVHGTNLRVDSIEDERTVLLRFMHHQSYGFQAYWAGDTVTFVDPSTMLRHDVAVVESVTRVTDRTVSVTLNRKIPKSVRQGATCLENLTCTPELEVRGCHITNMSTRGILATTPRRVVIENNVFDTLGMPGVLIEGDAEGWFESGPVTDVLIRGNRFIDCGFNGGPAGATIALNPSNTVVDSKKPVHTNIRIIDNIFETMGRPVLFAKSTSGILFEGNRIVGDGRPVFILQGCRDVKIESSVKPEIIKR